MRTLTPPGLAGVAVAHFDDAERAKLLACLMAEDGHPLILRAGAAPRRARLRIRGEVVDDVLVVDRGAVGVEVHTHGAPTVLRLLQEEFGESASPVDAASALLRHAMSLAQLQLAIEQCAVDFDRALNGASELDPRAARVAIAAAWARSRVAMALANPQRLVLVGRQNVGKSSLFNRMLFRERVLTGASPGLTRDPVVEVTTLSGYPYELVDTAGEGDALRPVDAQAIARGRDQRRSGMVVLVVDVTREPVEFEKELVRSGCFVLHNKMDLAAGQVAREWLPNAAVAAATELGSVIRSKVGEALRLFRELPVAGPVGGFAALEAGALARLRHCALELGLQGDCRDGP